MLKIRSLLITGLKNNKCLFSTVAMPKEKTVRVQDWDINYVKNGHGSINILCLPGAVGTIWTDYKPQVEGIDKDKFTVIAWDPPGYGKSRPPEKEFTNDFYEKDADLAHEFMKALNVDSYSVLGWSDGGITGMIHAAKYPKNVNKLVIWGSNSFILPHELESYNKTRDIKSWSPRMRQPMIDIYGEQTFADLWARWCDAMENIYKANKGDICSQILKDIKCPTLILHGEKDPMVDNAHVSHLHTHISGAKLFLYPDGKHNIHLKYSEDFNKRVQEFLLEPQSSRL